MGTDRAVVVFLRMVGTLDLLALPFALLPFAWIDKIHQGLGLGTLPNYPTVAYLARCVCLLYAANGALAWRLSTDVGRFAPLIGFEAAVAILLGTWILVVDCSVGMPVWWTALEGPAIAAMGTSLWLLLQRTRSRTNGALRDDAH